MYSRQFALVASTLLLACGGSSTTPSVTPPVTTPPVTTPAGPVVTTSVTMSGSAFVPPAIQVSPGATVVFTNSDGFNHNVTFADATIPSTGNYATGAKSVVMPAAAGTYAYVCTIHRGMTGTVKVQ